MTPRSITCPRCEGLGSVTSATGWTRDGEVEYRDERTRPCPTCRGTGQASLLEPMGDGGRKGFGHVNAGGPE